MELEIRRKREGVKKKWEGKDGEGEKQVEGETERLVGVSKFFEGKD